MSFQIKELEWQKAAEHIWVAKAMEFEYRIFTTGLSNRDWRLSITHAGCDMRMITHCNSLAHGQELANEDWRSELTPFLEPASKD